MQTVNQDGQGAKLPAHETFRVAAVLALVGGFLDIYTYLLRGGVFANAQTGNIVLLAANLAETNWSRAGYYLIPILAFSAGVFVTNLLKRRFSGTGGIRFEQVVLLIEAALLLGIGLLPLSVPDAFVNVTISFICSIQVNTFRKVRNVPYASTMCTGNLRSGTEKLYVYFAERERKALESAAHYFGIIGMFISGAVLGAAAARIWEAKSVWICCLLLVGTTLAIRERRKK